MGRGCSLAFLHPLFPIRRIFMLYIKSGSVSYYEYSETALEAVIDGVHIVWLASDYAPEQLDVILKALQNSIG